MKYLLNPKKVASEVRTLNLKDRNSVISLIVYVATFLSLVYPVFQPSKANAAVTVSFVRFDRHATGSAISGTACLETSTSGTETNVVIVFPNDWTVSSTASNWTVTTTNLPVKPSDGSAATAWPGIGTASSVSGNSVVFPGTDLSTATFYCFNFAGASSTIGAAGNDKTGQLKTQGGSPYVDSVDWATSVVSSNSDQITVTASVSASMTFSLSGNSASLGTLVTSSTPNAATAISQSVITNARNGWISWVKGFNDGGSGNAALHSTVANADIVSPGSFNGTPESLAAQSGYVLDVNTNAGTATIHAEYNGADTNSGGHIDTQFRQTAHHATTPTTTDIVDLVVRAKASSTTPAGNDYTDTLTVVAAGSF